MRIIFDSDFDSGAWPGPLGGKDASIGEMWTGPSGFLAALETGLGLGGVYPSSIERALGLVAALETTEGFWSKSVEVDPIGSARRILTLRDELWMCGWRGQGRSRRLKPLAAACEGIRPGLPDRLEEIAEALKNRSAGIERVVLLEDPGGLPAAWRAILDGLVARGTVVERLGLEPAGATGDLGASQKTGFVPKGDGSLQLLRPPGNLEAAEHVAALLSGMEDLSQTVVIWGDAVLDQALCRHGLPTTGGGAGGSRSVLATIMPLVISLGWSPPDPAVAAELLALPAGPVPPGLARNLIGALQEWPSICSDLWGREILGYLAERKAKGYRPGLAERLEVIFDSAVPRGSPYPVSEVKRRLKVLDRWLRGRRDGSHGDPEPWQAAVDQCAALHQMVTAYGRSELSRMELRLLLEQASEAAGSPRPWPAQAGIFSLGEPGGVAGKVGNVVWWNFSLSQYSPPAKIPLSKGEEKELGKFGIKLPDPGREAVRAAARWRRPLLQATDSVLLVCPQRAPDGEENFPHPAWDEIKSRLFEWHQVSELVHPRPQGRKLPGLKRRSLSPLPQRVTQLKVKKGLLKLRKTESPSSLGPLIGCPLQYVLKYTGKLYSGLSANLPDADDPRVRGSLSHLLLAEVLEQKRKGKDISPDQAREMAGKLFDEEAPRLMTVMFLPGNDAARAEVRRVVCEAAGSLVRLFEQMGLFVREIEERHTDQAMGIDVSGRLDLLAGDPEKVIDLKWSGAGYRIPEMEAGASYQLATYSRLVRGSKLKNFPPVAYFIIRENRLLTTDQKAFPEAEAVKGPDPSVTWAALEKAVCEVTQSLKEGTVLSGVDYESGSNVGSIKDGRLVLPPPCYFCDFAALCGLELEEE